MLEAEHGYAMAQYRLGTIYHDDEIIDQDFQEAAKWYKLAAEQGIADAQINHGLGKTWMLTQEAKSEKLQDNSCEEFYPNRRFTLSGLISANFNVHMGNLELHNHEECEVPPWGEQLEGVA